MIDNRIHSCILSEEEIHKTETEIKYEGYIARQKIEVQRFKKMEKKKIPALFDYDSMDSIGCEAKEKLKKIRPESIGHASRIPGISSCDLSLLAVQIEKYCRTTPKKQ